MNRCQGDTRTRNCSESIRRNGPEDASRPPVGSSPETVPFRSVPLVSGGWNILPVDETPDVPGVLSEPAHGGTPFHCAIRAGAAGVRCGMRTRVLHAKRVAQMCCAAQPGLPNRNCSDSMGRRARPSIRAAQSSGATQDERVVLPRDSEQIRLTRGKAGWKPAPTEAPLCARATPDTACRPRCRSPGEREGGLQPAPTDWPGPRRGGRACGPGRRWRPWDCSP